MSDSSVPSDEEIESFLGDVTIDPIKVDTFEEPVVEIVDDIPEESGFEESTVQIGDGTCNVCGAPTFRPPGLTKTGRKKRAPRYCDLHDPKRTISTERSLSRGMESQLKRVQDELADDLRLLGVLAGPLLPVTGFYVIEHADQFTIALLKLAKNNQSVLRVLHRVAQVAPVYTVAETVAGTAYAVQVDMQKADPHNTVSKRLGVEKAYNSIYPDQANVETNGAFQGPPRYAST